MFKIIGTKLPDNLTTDENKNTTLVKTFMFEGTPGIDNITTLPNASTYPSVGSRLSENDSFKCTNVTAKAEGTHPKCRFIVEATYKIQYGVNMMSGGSSKADKSSGDKVWTFSVNGRNTQLHEAYNTRSYRIETSGPDLSPGKLINWNGQNGAFAKSGSVDVIQPELTETCVATFKASKITASFMKKIADVVGKVNDSSFHHWASGEVLLSGITHGGEYENSSGKKLCDITFNFSIRPNETRNINGKIISIRGWDYFWILPSANDSSKIHMAYVSEVYQRADYGKLGL